MPALPSLILAGSFLMGLALAALAGQEHPPIASRTNPTPERPRRIILDVDPGIDDALAILLAVQSPELKIEAITVVSGNVLVDLGAENALKLVELAGRTDLLVAKGAKYPLQRKLITAELIHGQNGLGGAQLPAPKKKLDPRHASDVIIDLASANPGQITLVPVGPLTNVALAFLKDPTLASKIPEIILMGGSIVGGNASPAAEANIYNDPEAARVVFNAGVPVTMVDLGATHQALLTRSHLGILSLSTSPIGKFVANAADYYVGLAERFQEPGAALHDPLAVGMAIDKTLARVLRPMHIDVETRGELTYGETVANRSLYREGIKDAGDHYTIVDFPRVKPNAEVPLVVEGERFLKLFIDRVTARPRSGF